MNKVIFLVDMQSFYASCEKADHPDIRNKPVIVAGDPKKRSGIILAACPLAKKYGITTAEPLWQALQKCPQAVIMRPRMQRYIDVSIQITKIFEQFTDLVEPFSIDEQFLDVTGSQKIFGRPRAMAKTIQATIMRETGVFARVGIGPNKVLAKMACDNFGKKNADGIFELTHDNIGKYLWPLSIEKMFGVGHRMARNLLGMGIRKIGHLAHFPLEPLRQRWGINGELLWLTARGIDYSPVTLKTHDRQKAIGHHMTLPRDYSDAKAIQVILLELSEEVARRARAKGYMGGTLSLSIRGADFDFPIGFHRQTKLPFSTNFGLDIYKGALELFNRYWNKQPIRSAGVTLSELHPANRYQLDLFGRLLKKERLGAAMDQIRNKYGTTALFRASSLHPASQLFERANKIGGHYK